MLLVQDVNDRIGLFGTRQAMLGLLRKLREDLWVDLQVLVGFLE